MSEIVIKITQNILGKIVKPKLIPKMDLSKGVGKENSAMVTITTIIENRREGKKPCKKAGSILLS